MPQSLLCGEVRQVRVEFTNSGTCALHRLRVATSHPEFFTFGDKRGPNAIDNSAIYQTVISPSDSDTEEFVVNGAKVHHVLEVPVPGGQIAPGSTATLDMWIQGPSTHGVHEIDFLFYYESTKQSKHLRWGLLLLLCGRKLSSAHKLWHFLKKLERIWF